MPRKLWLKARYDELLITIERYRELQYIIKPEWFDELAKLNREIWPNGI